MAEVRENSRGILLPSLSILFDMCLLFSNPWLAYICIGVLALVDWCRTKKKFTFHPTKKYSAAKRRPHATLLTLSAHPFLPRKAPGEFRCILLSADQFCFALA